MCAFGLNKRILPKRTHGPSQAHCAGPTNLSADTVLTLSIYQRANLFAVHRPQSAPTRSMSHSSQSQSQSSVACTPGQDGRVAGKGSGGGWPGAAVGARAVSAPKPQASSQYTPEQIARKRQEAQAKRTRSKLHVTQPRGKASLSHLITLFVVHRSPVFKMAPKSGFGMWFAIGS